MHRTVSWLVLLAAVLLPAGLSAQDASGPGLKAGDVISYDKIDSLERYLPKEFWDNRDFFFYEGMKLEIGPTQRDYSPAKEYVDATEKFKGQAKIGPDGSLENYTAGQPFPVANIDCKNDPQAGVKIMYEEHVRESGRSVYFFDPEGNYLQIHTPL